MLREAGYASLGALFAAHGLPVPGALDLPPSFETLSEQAIRRRLRKFAAEVAPPRGQITLLGAGAGEYPLPAAVEALPGAGPVSPGEEEALGARFAARIGALVGMAAAPRLFTFDAMAAAAVRLISEARPGRFVVWTAETLPAAFASRLQAHCRAAGFACRTFPMSDGVSSPGALLGELSASAAAVVAGSPNAHGCIEPMSELGQIAHQAGALFVALADPLSLGLLRSPGEFTANLCCGELRGLGLSDRGPGGNWFLALGGHLADRLPAAAPGFRPAALRRVCAFFDHLGPEGFRRRALAVFENAHFLNAAIRQIAGFRAAFAAPFFNAFAIRTPLPAAEIVRELEEQGIFAGIPVDLPGGEAERERGLLVEVGENRTLAEAEYVLKALKQLRDRNAGKILGVDS